jgi:hypothetical protein
LTKEQLKKYRALKFELADVNTQIQLGSTQDSVQGSMKEFPWTIGTRHVEGVPDEDYDLLVRKSDLKAQIKEIEDFVNGIHNYRIKKAIQIYYIDDIESGEDKPTWEDVADKFYDGSTGDSVKQAVSRFIRNN